MSLSATSTVVSRDQPILLSVLPGGFLGAGSQFRIRERERIYSELQRPLGRVALRLWVVVGEACTIDDVRWGVGLRSR